MKKEASTERKQAVETASQESVRLGLTTGTVSYRSEDEVQQQEQQFLRARLMRTSSGRSEPQSEEKEQAEKRAKQAGKKKKTGGMLFTFRSCRWYCSSFFVQCIVPCF